MFDDARYLEPLRKSVDVIWRRGLLKKGYGICHGVAGNAYAFLRMYQLTRELKYLHRAAKVGIPGATPPRTIKACSPEL